MGGLGPHALHSQYERKSEKWVVLILNSNRAFVLPKSRCAAILLEKLAEQGLDEDEVSTHMGNLFFETYSERLLADARNNCGQFIESAILDHRQISGQRRGGFHRFSVPGGTCKYMMAGSSFADCASILPPRIQNALMALNQMLSSLPRPTTGNGTDSDVEFVPVCDYFLQMIFKMITSTGIVDNSAKCCVCGGLFGQQATVRHQPHPRGGSIVNDAYIPDDSKHAETVESIEHNFTATLEQYGIWPNEPWNKFDDSSSLYDFGVTLNTADLEQISQSNYPTLLGEAMDVIDTIDTEILPDLENGMPEAFLFRAGSIVMLLQIGTKIPYAKVTDVNTAVGLYQSVASTRGCHQLMMRKINHGRGSKPPLYLDGSRTKVFVGPDARKEFCKVFWALHVTKIGGQTAMCPEHTTELDDQDMIIATKVVSRIVRDITTKAATHQAAGSTPAGSRDTRRTKKSGTNTMRLPKQTQWTEGAANSTMASKVPLSEFHGRFRDSEGKGVAGDMLPVLNAAKNVYRNGKIQEAVISLRTELMRVDPDTHPIHSEDARGILYNLVEWCMEADSYGYVEECVDTLMKLNEIDNENGVLKSTHALFAWFYKGMLLVRTSKFDSAYSAIDAMKRCVEQYRAKLGPRASSYFLALRELVKAEYFFARNDFSEATTSFSQIVQDLAQLRQETRKALIQRLTATTEIPSHYTDTLEFLRHCLLRCAYATSKQGGMSSFKTAINGFAQLEKQYRAEMDLDEFGIPEDGTHYCFVEVNLLWGLTLLQAEQGKAALKKLKYALQLSQRLGRQHMLTARAHYYVGMAYEIYTDNEQAKDHFSEALLLMQTAFPDATERCVLGASVTLAMARLMVNVANYSAAVNLLDKVAMADPLDFAFPPLISLMQAEWARSSMCLGQHQAASVKLQGVISLLENHHVNRSPYHAATASIYSGLLALNRWHCVDAIISFQRAHTHLSPKNNTDFCVVFKVRALCALALARLYEKFDSGSTGLRYIDSSDPNATREPLWEDCMNDSLECITETICKRVVALKDQVLDFLDRKYLKGDDFTGDKRRIDLFLLLAEALSYLGVKYSNDVDELLSKADEENTATKNSQRGFSIARMPEENPDDAFTNEFDARIAYMRALQIGHASERKNKKFIQALVRCFSFYNKFYFSKRFFPPESLSILHLKVFAVGSRAIAASDIEDELGTIVNNCIALKHDLKWDEDEVMNQGRITKALLPMQLSTSARDRLESPYEYHKSPTPRVYEDEAKALSERVVPVENPEQVPENETAIARGRSVAYVNDAGTVKDVRWTKNDHDGMDRTWLREKTVTKVTRQPFTTQVPNSEYGMCEKLAMCCCGRPPRERHTYRESRTVQCTRYETDDRATRRFPEYEKQQVQGADATTWGIYFRVVPEDESRHEVQVTAPSDLEDGSFIDQISDDDNDPDDTALTDALRYATTA
eukprot:m.950578 g.950578  ORF g.950578 m.950578 type:complete len:1444 (-) comp23860_c0_seq1:123-4454(-)